MNTANKEIREALRSAKIPIWRLAYSVGVHENTMLRRLRIELSESEKAEYLKIIKKIKKETV